MTNRNANGKLPDGWKWVMLGEVCKVVSGSTPSTGVPEYWGGDIIWVTPTDLGQLTGNRIVSSARQITKSGYLSCGTEMVPPGSVILSTRAPIGHLGIAGLPVCTNQGCKAFVPGPDVDSEFLYYSLEQAVPLLKVLGSGATFTEISKTQCQAFQIPLPPLHEQKRIAAILNEQMRAVDQARAATEAQLEAAKTLPAAYLRTVFNGPEAQRWPRKRPGDTAEVMAGVALGRRLPEAGTRLVPYLRVANVKDGYLDLAEVYETPATEAEIKTLHLDPGDLLLTEASSPEIHMPSGALAQPVVWYSLRS